MIISENSNVRLLGVMDMSWGKTNCHVKGRPYAALSFRIKGEGKITQGDVETVLGDGDVLYMPKNANYRIDSGKERILVVHFDVNAYARESMMVYTAERAKSVAVLFQTLYETWNLKKPGYYFEAISVFYKILYELGKSSSMQGATEYQKIRAAADYLHAHFCDADLDVKTLCKKAYVSDTYFRKLFEKAYGKTPRKYLVGLRVDYAKALLAESNLTVERVAYESGFSDVKYFSTAFLKHVGKSPSAFRKKPM